LLKDDIHWVAGFVDGDGAFYFTLHKARDYKYGYQVKATFDIRPDRHRAIAFSSKLTFAFRAIGQNQAILSTCE